MFCPNCGAELPDDAKFCRSCGAPLADQTVAEEGPVTVTETVVEYTNPGANPAGNPGQAANPAGAGQAAPSGPAVTVQVSNTGVLGRAWNDLTHSKGWWKKVLLLSVINLIPFYNLASWGRIVQFGVGAADPNSAEHTELNLEDLNASSFKAGLVVVLGGIFTGVFGVGLPFFTGMIPLIGWILLPVLIVIFQIWINLSVCRSVLKDKLTAALDLTAIYRASKNNKGKLVGAVFVPGLVCLLIGIVAGMILVAIAAGVVVSSLGSMSSSMASSMGSSMSSSYLPASLGVIGAFFDMLGKVKIFLLFFILLGQFLFTLQNSWTYRAIGHWIAMSAPEWADSPNNETCQ